MKLKEEYEKFNELHRKGYVFCPIDNIFYTSNKGTFQHPENYENWSVEEYTPSKYREERLKELGISEEDQKIELFDGTDKGEYNVFTANKFGDIEILQYSLKRKLYKYVKQELNDFVREGINVQTRLHPIRAEICEGKYDFSEAKNAPFWHKSLIEAFEDEQEIETLVITEGQFKAYKSCHDGIPTVGLTSISHFKNGKTQKIHSEIIEFIQRCKVKNVVILWDGDCRNISEKSLRKNDDLSIRPQLFYSFATKIREFLIDFFTAKKINVYFATINLIEELANPPKGIDDLLIYLKSGKQLQKDIANIGKIPSEWIYWEDITRQDKIKKRLRKFFNLHSVRDFYNFHSELIKQQSFVWFGSTYRVEKGIPIIEISKDLKNFKRVGDSYYETINKPFSSPSGSVIYEEYLSPRQKQTIIDDYGKDAPKHVDKYKDFVNIANHIDYQPVIGNCLNLYHELNHSPEDGEWSHIQMLLEHIFRDKYEMILDYITILYRFPLQKLPTICLVSKTQKTGKSTFVYLMKLIFQNNMIGISNSDFTENFNDHWITKLVVACEETMFDKKDAYEKIKDLTTNPYINRKEKNKSASSISNMLHFIFCSNHEDDFVKIDQNDSRLWITKVHGRPKAIDGFEEKLEDEVNAFVYYLMNREITHPKKSRLWFLEELFRTDAFHNVVKHSEPGIIKEIRSQLTDLFLVTGVNEIKMTVKDIKKEFGIHKEEHYINKEIQTYIKAERITDKHGKPTVRGYSYYVPDHEGKELITRKGKGRPFIFKQSEFVKEILPQESKYKQVTIHEEIERSEVINK